MPAGAEQEQVSYQLTALPGQKSDVVGGYYLNNLSKERKTWPEMVRQRVEAEAAAVTPAPGIEAEIAQRKAVVNRGLETATRGDVVKVLAGVDEGMDAKSLQEIRIAIGSKLAAAGIGGDNVKLETYVRVKGRIDKTRENCERKKARMIEDLQQLQLQHEANVVSREEHNGLRYTLVVFDDESKGEFDKEKYAKGAQPYGGVYVIDVPDRYTDCDAAQGKYPDLEYRAMLATHIASVAVRSPNEAALNELLEPFLKGMVENNIGELVAIVDGRLVFRQPIRIIPIYEKIEEWKRLQKLVNVSV